MYRKMYRKIKNYIYFIKLSESFLKKFRLKLINLIRILSSIYPLDLLSVTRHISRFLAETMQDQSSVYSMIGTTDRTQILPSNVTILFFIVSWDMVAMSCMREKCRRQAKYVRTRHRFDLRPRNITNGRNFLYSPMCDIAKMWQYTGLEITGKSKYQISIF